MQNMFVKYQEINNILNNKVFPLYVIFGQDQYLQDDISNRIKKAWKKLGDVDEEIINVDDDWENTFAKANSYSLFSDLSLLDIRYSKKTISNNFKESITKYLKNYNSKTLVIIRAPNITSKQLQFLTSSKNIQIFGANQLSAHELEKWIKAELQSLKIVTERNVPNIILQYNQNNMLAAQQTIIKLSMLTNSNEKLTESSVLEFINDQSEYPVYELTTKCLQGNSLQAINILRKFANNNQNTSIYILWLLSYEIRLLIQLKQMNINKTPMHDAYKKLKIWSQKIKMYETAMQRFTLGKLEELLTHCAQLDLQLKSSTDVNVWDKLERLVLLICLGCSRNDKILVNEI